MGFGLRAVYRTFHLQYFREGLYILHSSSTFKTLGDIIVKGLQYSKLSNKMNVARQKKNN